MNIEVAPDPRHAVRRVSLETRVAAVLVAAAAVVMVKACIFHAVPAFQHDWIWPFNRTQAFSTLTDAYRIWHHGGSGIPSAAPNGVVGLSLLMLFAVAFGPVSGLTLAVCSLLFVSFASMTQYLRVRGNVDYAAAIGGLLYTCSPVFFNKLGAGHYLYLIGFAGLPTGLWLLAEARTRYGAKAFALTLSAGVSFALCACQFQFAAIVLVVVAIDALTEGKKGNVRWSLVSVATMVVLHAPDYSIMLLPQSEAAYSPQAIPMAWLGSQGQPFWAAFSAIPYIGNYAERAALFTPISVAGVVLALLAFGFALALRDAEMLLRRNILAGAISLVIGATLISGTFGPLGGIITLMFQSIKWASAFRELYDFSVLCAFGLAMVATSMVGCPRRGIRIPSFIAVGLLLAAFVGIYNSRPPGATISALSPSAASVRANAGAGRIAFFPSGPALALRGTSVSGVDSFAQQWSSHSALTYSMGDLKLAYLFSVYNRALFERLGTQQVVSRPQVRSNYQESLDPRSRELVRKFINASRGNATGAAYALLRSDTAAPDTVRRTEDVVLGPPLWPFVASVRLKSEVVSIPLASFAVAPPLGDKYGVPTDGWTSSLRWASAIRDLSCFPGASTFRVTSVDLAAHYVSKCSWTVKNLGRIACYHSALPGIEAFGGCIDNARWDALRVQVRKHEQRIWTKREQLAYIRESFDSRWQLFCGGSPLTDAAPVLVDAYAMGWFISRDSCPGHLTASFSSDRWFGSTVLMLWVTAGFAILALFSLRKTQLWKR